MAGDFGSGTGNVQGVAPNTKPPSKSGTPKTGFDSAGGNARAANGPTKGIRGSERKIR